MEMMHFDELYEKQIKKLKEVSNMEPSIRDANVEHPDHYQHNGIETIDIINAWTNDLEGGRSLRYR